jgi:nucleoside-diphosphate-sugar epimerase
MGDIVRDTQPDVVYHFAAQALNELSYQLPETTMDANVKGTLNLLEALRREGLAARVLMAGSSAEYGRASGGAIREDAALDPHTAYGVSKSASEMLARQYFRTYHLPVVTARLFTQIGPGGADSIAIQQLCRQIALAELSGQPLTLEHPLMAHAHDVSDIVETAPLLVELAEKGVPGEAYNVGSKSATTLKELAEEAAKLAKVRVAVKLDTLQQAAAGDAANAPLLASTDKLAALTGKTPKFDRKAAVERILNYWRKAVTALYTK